MSHTMTATAASANQHEKVPRHIHHINTTHVMGSYFAKDKHFVDFNVPLNNTVVVNDNHQLKNWLLSL